MFYFGIFYFLPDQINLDQQLFTQATSLATIFGSPIAGNLSTLVGRFTSSKVLDTGSGKNIKDLDKSKSSNILFEFVRTAIAERLDEKIIEMSRTYEWDTIKSIISRLIDSEIAFSRISAQEGESVRTFVMAFEKSGNEIEDMDNKYKVFHRVIQFSSFRLLSSRLERLRKQNA